MWNDWHMGWMSLWWLVGLLLVIAVVWAVARTASGPSPADESPPVILKRRYASGEINREQYERRLSDLQR